MNSAQSALYFYEWSQVRKYYLARGLDPKQADAKRHDLHRKALGRDKSSKAFSNAELDRVIGAFRAVWDGGNLAAQLGTIDAGHKRRTNALRRIVHLRGFLGLNADHEDAYVAGIARNLFGTDQYEDLTDANFAQLEGVIVRRLKQLHSDERVAEIRAGATSAAAKPTEGEDPF